MSGTTPLADAAVSGSTVTVAFIGKSSAIDQQAESVWDHLDKATVNGSAVECTVTLYCSNHGKVAQFKSIPRSRKVDGRIRWTAEEKAFNLVTMKKLWRYENRDDINVKRRVRALLLLCSLLWQMRRCAVHANGLQICRA